MFLQHKEADIISASTFIPFSGSFQLCLRNSTSYSTRFRLYWKCTKPFCDGTRAVLEVLIYQCSLNGLLVLSHDTSMTSTLARGKSR